MDTELIVAVAQIATGMATLILALFLAGQLLLQRRQLDIAHQDSVRELGFTARARQEEVALARLTEESLLEGVRNKYHMYDIEVEESDPEPDSDPTKKDKK